MDCYSNGSGETDTTNRFLATGKIVKVLATSTLVTQNNLPVIDP